MCSVLQKETEVTKNRRKEEEGRSKRGTRIYPVFETKSEREGERTELKRGIGRERERGKEMDR